MTTSVNEIKISSFHKEKIISIFVVLSAIMTGLSIANGKWLYVGIVFIPILLYLCIIKPFIFPFGLYVFLVPFDSILSITGSDKGTTITKLLGIITIIVLILKGAYEKKLKRPDVAASWWFLFIIYSVSSFLWAMDPARVLSVIPTIAGLFIFYLVTASYKIHKNDFDILKWCIIMGGFLASIYVIYKYGQVFQDGEGVKRATMRLGHQQSDENQFAFSLIIPFSLCVQMLMAQKKKLINIIYWIILCVVFSGVIATGSRGGFLGIVIVLIIYILFSKQRMTLSLVGMVMGILLMSLFADSFIERWSQAGETGGAGRFDIWYVGLNALKKYWIYGAGLNNFTYAFDEFAASTLLVFNKSTRGGHNILIGYFVELGVIGITFMSLAIIKHYHIIRTRLTSSFSDAVMLKASFWGVMLSSMFLDTMVLKSFWLLWIMIMIHKNLILIPENKKV